MSFAMIHLSSMPRRRNVARCGRVIDGLEHTQTMMAGQVECTECLQLFRAKRPRGGFALRPAVRD